MLRPCYTFDLIANNNRLKLRIVEILIVYLFLYIVYWLLIQSCLLCLYILLKTIFSYILHLFCPHNLINQEGLMLPGQKTSASGVGVRKVCYFECASDRNDEPWNSIHALINWDKETVIFLIIIWIHYYYSWGAFVTALLCFLRFWKL
jgi:hypothetical protein